MVTIKNWSVVVVGEYYRAPEIRSRHLAGEAYGHPKFPDGHRVVTSRIIEVKGRVVRTLSREYELSGPPSDQYATWLHDQGITFDEANPIKSSSTDAN